MHNVSVSHAVLCMCCEQQRREGFPPRSRPAAPARAAVPECCTQPARSRCPAGLLSLKPRSSCCIPDCRPPRAAQWRTNSSSFFLVHCLPLFSKTKKRKVVFHEPPRKISEFPKCFHGERHALRQWRGSETVFEGKLLVSKHDK
jgi:hypothetical protein